MDLQKELDAHIAGAKARVPAPGLALIEKAISELKESGIAKNALKVGDKIPSFSLPNAFGKNINSYDLLKDGPLVINFYRGSWCPFCNIELNALQKSLPEIKALGASLVAISPEKADFAGSMIEKHQLTFEVLSDLGNKIARQFGLVFVLQGNAKKVSQELFQIDLLKFNDDSSFELPIPGTFVVDKNGIIKLAFADSDYRRRLEPGEILKALKEMQ